MADLLPLIKQRFLDANGLPLAGGKLYTYYAGTTTPRATYVDKAGVTQNANPIILDSRGEADVWISTGYYKFKLTTSADVDQYTVDNVGLPGTAAQTIPSAGTVGQYLRKLSATDYDTEWADLKQGRAALANAAQTVSVSFATNMANTTYKIAFSFENVTDSDPIFLQGVVTAKTVSGFLVTFNAPTDSANYVFNWIANN